MMAASSAGLAWIGQRGDRADGLAGPFPPSAELAAARDLDGPGGVGEGQPGGHGGDLHGAALLTAVSALAGVIGDRDLPPGPGRELCMQARLVALDREEVMGTAAGQAGGVAALSMHRLGGDDRPGDAYAIEQDGEHRDLVVFAPNFHLARDGAVSMIEGGQQVITGGPAASRAA